MISRHFPFIPFILLTRHVEVKADPGIASMTSELLHEYEAAALDIHIHQGT